jgi:hypothetical protein
VTNKKYIALLEKIASMEARITVLEKAPQAKEKKEVITPVQVMDEWLNGAKVKK